MSRPRVNGPLTVALAAAILVAALGAVSLSRAVATFQPLGFAAQRAAGGWTVAAVQAPETGLAAGDQILLAGGTQVTALGEVLRGSPETQLLVMRGGTVEPVTYHRPPLRVDWTYLVLALIGVLYLLIGVYTGLRERRRETLLFYLWCLASAVVYLFTPSGVADATGRLLYAAEELARAALPPLTLHLFLVFPTPLVAASGGSSRSRRRIHWTAFLYLPAAVLLTLQVGLIVSAGRQVSAATASRLLPVLDRATLLHLVTFALAALGVLVYRLGRHRDWEEHRQLQWIAIGLGVGYLPFLLLYVVPFSLGATLPHLLTVLAVLPLAVVPLTFAWAILRYKLWDIGVVVRETVSTALTVLLAGGAFALAHLAISRGVSEGLGWVRDFLSFGSGLAIATMLLPTRRQVGTVLERLQYGRAIAKRRALERLGRELLHERDLDRLCRELLEDLTDAIELSGANLYLADGAHRLLPVLPELKGPESIDLGELGSEIWRREVEALTGISLPKDRLSPRQRLFLAGYRYAFPLAVRGVPVGLLVATFRAGDIPLSSDDLDLVRSLLSGAALSSPAGIAVLAADGRIRSANAAFATLVGRERTSLAGERVAEVLPIHPLPEPGAGIVEVSYCDGAGRERHLQLSAAGFRLPEGSAVGDAGAGELRILVVHDVSERAAMEKALREKDRLAALGLLAAGVAHEVNTPITGISSYAQMLLAETPEDDPRHEILRKVERQTFRAARIVNNLLEFARDRDEERHPVDLAPLIAESLDLVDPRREKRRVALELRLPDAPLMVDGSDGELQQVITNLALNAIDAMPGGGTLTVEAGAQDGLARVAVSDTGHGIEPERLERIFEPLFSTKIDRGGTGLGLSISYDIVRRHGGTLQVDSEVGKGSRFVVELPLAGETAAGSSESHAASS
jgi:signal transduction histidine kinase